MFYMTGCTDEDIADGTEILNPMRARQASSPCSDAQPCEAGEADCAGNDSWCEPGLRCCLRSENPNKKCGGISFPEGFSTSVDVCYDSTVKYNKEKLPPKRILAKSVIPEDSIKKSHFRLTPIDDGEYFKWEGRACKQYNVIAKSETEAGVKKWQDTKEHSWMKLHPVAGGDYFLIETEKYPGHYYYTPNKDVDLKIRTSLDSATDWIEIRPVDKD